MTLYDDALPALKWLSERYPLVAVSNGNADIHQTGVGRWFRTAFNARAFGSGKPHAPIFRAAAASVGLLPQRRAARGRRRRRSMWWARSTPACRRPGWCATRSGPGRTARGRS